MNQEIEEIDLFKDIPLYPYQDNTFENNITEMRNDPTKRLSFIIELYFNAKEHVDNFISGKEIGPFFYGKNKNNQGKTNSCILYVENYYALDINSINGLNKPIYLLKNGAKCRPSIIDEFDEIKINICYNIDAEKHSFSCQAENVLYLCKKELESNSNCISISIKYACTKKFLLIVHLKYNTPITIEHYENAFGTMHDSQCIIYRFEH